ncbi:MAG: Smr/MutS family protein [Gammaproteobacteria bacterium]|nr:Smr/MutS family protein [Gammaproteobacteria bacterium]
MAKQSRIPNDEILLFHRFVGAVKRLTQDRITGDKPKPPPVPTQRQLDDRQVRRALLAGDFDPSELETGEELLYARPGVQHNLFRKLRRGQFSIEAELDLHGMSVDAAFSMLCEFLSQCQARNRRCVRIVHGKGHRSRNKQPILKNKINTWLRQRNEVLAFCSTRSVDGGTGAVYVLLKRR